MIVTGERVYRREVARGGLTPTFPARVGSTCTHTGRARNGPASFINFRSTCRLATWAGVVVGARGAGACLPGRYQDATGGGRSMVPVWAEASNASTAFIQIQVP